VAGSWRTGSPAASFVPVADAPGSSVDEDSNGNAAATAAVVGSGALPLRRRSEARPPKTAVLLARHIVDEITDRRLVPGDRLTPEREMLVQYGVGRGTLREALRFLEIQGIVRMKSGPGGGAVVNSPDSSHLASTLALLFQVRGSTFAEVLELRSIIETSLAGLAAERATAEDIAGLAECVETMEACIDDLDAFLEENSRFHERFAAASGNPLSGLLVEGLHYFGHSTLQELPYTEANRRELTKAHRMTLAAIRDRDPAAAVAAMRVHIDDFTAYLQRSHPGALTTPVRWTWATR